MLNEKDARHDSLRRIADTLCIPIGDLYGKGENSKRAEQTDRMLMLWGRLSTDNLREDVLKAIRSVVAENRY